jgi:hypothetical protein
MISMYSVLTSKKTFLHYNNPFLMPFKKLIDVYSENHMKPVTTLCGQNAEELLTTRIYH